MGKGAMFIIVRTVFLFWLLMQPSTSFPFERKTTIVVKNELEGRQDLFLHCISKDNDLGVQHLRSNETTKWSFGVNFLLTTLFHCSFEWKGASQKFVIYDARRDFHVCDLCSWIVREKGPCIVFENLQCFDWNS